MKYNTIQILHSIKSVMLWKSVKTFFSKKQRTGKKWVYNTLLLYCKLLEFIP